MNPPFRPIGLCIAAGLLAATFSVSPWFLAAYAGYILYSAWAEQK